MSKIHKPKMDSIVNSHIPIFCLKTNKPGTGFTQQLKALAMFLGLILSALKTVHNCL